MEKKISKTVLPDRRLKFNEWFEYTKASNMYVTKNVQEKFDEDNKLSEFNSIPYPLVHSLEMSILNGFKNLNRLNKNFKLKLIRKWVEMKK